MKPLEVLAYLGYGSATRAHVYGRALERRGVSASTDTDSTWRNLLNTWRRAEADPLPFAKLAVEYAGTSTEISADDEGFFNATIAYLLIAHVGDFHVRSWLHVLALGLGALLISMFSARHFGHFHGGNTSERV